MRLMIILALVISSVSAFAGELVSRKFSFSYSGQDLGTRTYYNCDVVEDMLEAHLETLGAKNVRVSCSGGLDTWSNGGGWGRGNFGTPVFLSARFLINNSTENAERIVLKPASRFNSSCDFNVSLLNKLIKSLPNTTLISKRSSCRGTEGNWTYTVDAAL